MCEGHKATRYFNKERVELKIGLRMRWTFVKTAHAVDAHVAQCYVIAAGNLFFHDRLLRRRNKNPVKSDSKKFAAMLHDTRLRALYKP